MVHIGHEFIIIICVKNYLFILCFVATFEVKVVEKVLLSMFVCQVQKFSFLETLSKFQDVYTTLEPLLSGHPPGHGKWLIKRGWTLSRVRQNLS